MTNNEDYMKIAITFARMYGVAEALEPFQSKPFDDFNTMIQEWTTEFLESNQEDVIQFFEDKIKPYTK